MRRALAVLTACALLSLSGCGSDTHDKLMAERLELTKQLNKTLDGITDKQTAEAAEPELESLTEQLKAVDQRQKALGEPSEAEQEALKEKYGKEMIAEGMRAMGNSMRLQGNPEVESVLKDIGQ